MTHNIYKGFGLDGFAIGGSGFLLGGVGGAGRGAGIGAGVGFAAGGVGFLTLFCACAMHPIIISMPIKITFFINR
jgi:hypothetical protein